MDNNLIHILFCKCVLQYILENMKYQTSFDEFPVRLSPNNV